MTAMTEDPRMTRYDVASARVVLNLPSRGDVAVWRTASDSSRCSVSYTTPQGDLVQAKRPAESFRAACAHLGVNSSRVRRVSMTSRVVLVQQGDSLARDTTRYTVPSLADTLRGCR